MVPILVKILSFIERQELDQRLAIDAHTFLTCTADGLVRLLTRHMDDVQRHTSCIGNCDGPIGGLAFKLRRAGIGVTFGASDAFRQHLLLHISYQITVFSMHHGQCAQLFTTLERGEHFVVLNHQRAFVGHEMFKRVHAHIHSVFHLGKDVFVPAGDRHVVADVRTNLRR